MASLDKVPDEEPEMVDDVLLDEIGGKTMRFLEKSKFNNVYFIVRKLIHICILEGLLDSEKFAACSYGQLVQWNLSEDTIAKCRIMCGKRTGFQSAGTYFQQSEKFLQVKFNIKSLDDLLEGGIDVGSVTELFGEAGSGKTQLCMQLALSCQLSPLKGKTVFISSIKSLPTQRLVAMADAMGLKYEELQHTSPLDNIFINNCYTSTDLQELVKTKLPRLLSDHPDIRLVIIDSIAGVFMTQEDYIDRAKQMRSIVHALERLADLYNFAIVTTNHVVVQQEEFQSSSETKAALGATWDSLVVTKLKIGKTDDLVKVGSEILRVKFIEVVYSPRLPRSKAKFSIDSSGIISID